MTGGEWREPQPFPRCTVGTFDATLAAWREKLGCACELDFTFTDDRQDSGVLLVGITHEGHCPGREPS